MSKAADSNLVTTRCFRSWVREDDIVCNQVIPNAELVLEDAVDGVENYYKLSKENRLPLIVDIRKIHSISAEARAHFSRERLNDFPPPGTAILISSAVSKVIGNFFIGLNRLAIPTKLFTDENKAVAWLKGL